ncbi:hypothetical protein HPP92_001726 [Vanilla planifolia]|uniref:Uncharacterized protein n=1 Tax=Vanilla planifolia TaxID=51239 RepID=A0A835VI94_VANPL|nr:hypothetical protein HPP92_001726 [Vanilla planifolia]
MMRLCSPQSHSTCFLLPTSPNSCANLANFNANPNFYRTKLTINIIVLLVKSPHISSRSCFATPLPDPVLCSESKEPNAEQREEEGEGKEALEGLILPVRRPVKQSSDEAIDSCDNVNENVGMNDSASDSKIGRSLSKLAKKMPIFEPKRGVTPEQKPLRINLELGIYRAKVFTLKFKFEEANQILQKCIWFWPEDGRAYVALGKLLCRQSG